MSDKSFIRIILSGPGIGVATPKMRTVLGGQQVQRPVRLQRQKSVADEVDSLPATAGILRGVLPPFLVSTGQIDT